MKSRPADAEIQGWFCPLQRPRLIELRLRSGKCIRTDLGLEKRCPRCELYWPMDTEFWFPSNKEDGLFGWCRACYLKHRWPDRYALPVRPVAAPVTELLQAVSGFSTSQVAA
jgi:hypothetical protein